jgi:hypothetical protein
VVLSLPGNGGLFVLLDGLRREVTAGDVGEVLGAEAGRELGGDTRGVGLRERRQQLGLVGLERCRQLRGHGALGAVVG